MTAKLNAVDVFTWFVEMVQLMDKGLLENNIWVQFYPKLLKIHLYSVKKSMGSILSNKAYSCFVLAMTLSICIQTFAIRLVNSKSSGFNCFWPLVKEGMTNSAPYVPNASEILNPLSAITLSSRYTFLKKFEFSVICWSLDLPLYPSEIKQIKPCGIISIRYFAVWWCLSEDQVRFCAVKFFGWSIYNSKQSIMTVFFFQKYL